LILIGYIARRTDNYGIKPRLYSTENEMSQRQIQSINTALLEELLQQARASARRRAIHCLHAGSWEHAHRMLNALVPGTYVCPHRHPNEYKGEGFILLRGRMALLIFTDDGQVDYTQSRVLTARDGCLGLDIPPGVWHSLVPLEESVIYEVKGQPSGGYVQEHDKEFAPWAPLEETAGAAEYGRWLEQAAQNCQ
jgi:cupin fold WbuC family metalloprotein